MMQHHFLVLLLALSAATGMACQRASTEAAVPTLAEQAAAVRNKTSDKIEVPLEIVHDADLRVVAGLTNLRELNIQQGNLSDEIAPLLGENSGLEVLHLRGARWTDQACPALLNMKSLRILNLPQADFTDAGLAQIAQLENLELLRLRSPQITEKGMSYVQNMKSLRWIHLIDIPITDAGLNVFHKMPQLESLYIDGGRFTDEGIEQLLAARPDLHIHFNQAHHDRDPIRRAHKH